MTNHSQFVGVGFTPTHGMQCAVIEPLAVKENSVELRRGIKATRENSLRAA